jgi:hypothetical protein
MLHLEGCNVSLNLVYLVAFLLTCLAEIVLMVVLFVRRQYRVFPVFTFYIVFNVFVDFGVPVLMAGSSKSFAHSVAIALLPPQYFLEGMVLFEIAWHVLRPVQVSLPRGALQAFALCMVLALLGGALLAWHVDVHGTTTYVKLKAPLDLTVGLLRMLIFVVTAAFAQVLGIGWKNKVLQLATALSLYSAVDLVVSLVQSHSGLSHTLEHIRAVNYLFELCFLVFAFTTKDVERREFSPQMEQFLVTLAGRARLARTALIRMQVK